MHPGRSLKWIICLLQFSELSFHHLFHPLDGVTAGPKSFSGPIGEKNWLVERKFHWFILNVLNALFLKLIAEQRSAITTAISEDLTARAILVHFFTPEG
ncbi:hypothetical protein NPIL_681381 [Nephila pilipes]|uniref:Uncharacterized protein n=1 Tax=Nephila pilipes TaxID=299642 RepID=A0A8X6MVQ0_NEPPI|nr:hypothetical protein NPIL_681381 [Nephila pilipes]